LSLAVLVRSPFEKLSVNRTYNTIANDELEYEVIIIDPGFNTWLVSEPSQRLQLAEFYGE
jgi:hypothetical protein